MNQSVPPDLTRRGFLIQAGATAAVAPLVGCPPLTTAQAVVTLISSIIAVFEAVDGWLDLSNKGDSEVTGDLVVDVAWLADDDDVFWNNSGDEMCVVNPNGNHDVYDSSAPTTVTIPLSGKTLKLAPLDFAEPGQYFFRIKVDGRVINQASPVITVT